MLALLGQMHHFDHSLAKVEHDQPLSTAAITNSTTIFLPTVMYNRVCDFDGSATLNGNPVRDVVVGLNQSEPVIGKFTVLTSTTDAQGGFCFSNTPILTSCDHQTGYSVYFGNDLPLEIQGTTHSWHSGLLLRCQPEQAYHQLQAELSDIAVLTPTDFITTSTPVTFSWMQSGSPESRYTLFIGICGPFDVGTATSFVLSEWCGKPWEPTEWHINEETSSYRKTSQSHFVTLSSP